MNRLITLAIALSLVACTQGGDPWYTTPSTGDATGGDDVGTTPAVLDDEILQIFEDNSCLGCHGNGATSGGLDLSTLEGLLAGGDKAGPAIVPCDPEASPLLDVIQGGIDDGTISVLPMPLGGDAVG
ncbi:MAG: c-type cytochrome domain-containing protein, partial [Myxococcota bacterium]|nr:c-type cytochrome domain-containing protein [Myxococcota bacterium]